MTRQIMTLVLLACAALPLFSKTVNREWQDGKLISVEADEQLVQGTTHRTAVFTVQVGDIVFTSRGGRISLRAHDYAQGLVVGDPVKVVIDGDKLILLKPNDRELKTTIIRRARSH